MVSEYSPASKPLPLLDRLETNAQEPYPRLLAVEKAEDPTCRNHHADSYRHFRHAGWKTNRQHVAESLHVLDKPPFKVVDRFLCCGDRGVVWQTQAEPRRFKVTSNRCRNRWCVPCQSERANTVAFNLAKLLTGKEVRLVTVTLRHSRAPLDFQLRQLSESWQRLRKEPDWKATQHAGVSFLEVKLSRDGDGWHPHIHALTTGRYLCTKRLSAMWERASRGSFITDIKLIRNPEKVASYVTKYLTKPVNQACYSDRDKLQEAMAALKSRRMMTTFGTWRGVKLTAKPEPGPEKWERLCSWENVYALSEKNPGSPLTQWFRSLLNRRVGEHATTGRPRGSPDPTYCPILEFPD